MNLLQLTLNIEPGLAERHKSLKDCVRERAYGRPESLKDLAEVMGMTDSDLSRKLGGNPGDPRNFTTDNLEAYLEATGDHSPIFYLIEKYAVSIEAKQSFAAAEFARLLPRMLALARQMGVKP